MPEDKRMRHVVVSGKLKIVGDDWVQSPEEYNYAELGLLSIIQKRSRPSRTASTSPR
jgi:hypothetical protein